MRQTKSEGNLPGSLICGIRGTQRSKIAQNSSKIGLNLNSRKHTVSIPYFEDLVETNKKEIEGNLSGSLFCGIRGSILTVRIFLLKIFKKK